MYFEELCSDERLGDPEKFLRVNILMHY